MPASTHPLATARRALATRTSGQHLIAFAWFLVLGYGLVLLAMTGAPSPLAATVGVSLAWLPAVVAGIVAFRRGSRVSGTRLAAAALVSFCAGLTLNGLLYVSTGEIQFPAPGDAGYAGFYVLISVALIRHLRRRVPRLGFVTALDAAVALLAIAAVLSVPLVPALAATLGSTSHGLAAFLVYPFSDLALAASILGLVAVTPGVLRGWPWLVGGLILFAASDIAFSLGSDSTALPQSSLQVGWGVGLMAIAQWVVVVSHAPPPAPRNSRYADRIESRRTARTAGLSAGIAAAGVLTVLLIGIWNPLPVEAAALAAATTVGAAVRTQIGFRLLASESRLRALAHTDELTGLPNRRELGERAERFLTGVATGQHAVLMLDLNGFKAVNDTWGHATGDRVLAEAARRLNASVRLTDIVARVGGDEFAILMPDADREVALTVAGRIRDTLREPLATEPIATVIDTSIGVALFPGHGRDLASLLRTADAAMYAAKAAHAAVLVAGSLS
jgi:diguanylate cyclase (GGDEF)-like protein